MINLSRSAVSVGPRRFWARVSTRPLSLDMKPQGKMRLYTIAFQYEKPLHHAQGSVRARRVIAPVTVQVLHLLETGTVIIHYSLVEPDRNEQGETLPKPEIRRIEPHLASMVKQAMQSSGIDIEVCKFEVHCTGSNLVRDRGTAETKPSRWAT